MKKNSLIARLSIACLLLWISALTAGAQSNRTWVGGSGDDANAATNCPRTAPCKTFAVALTKTNAGGEINVTDAGSFGPVMINKSVTIDAGGIFAGVQVGSGTDAVTIDAPAGSVIVLRGLTLNGLVNTTSGAGRDGVTYTGSGSLYIENCVIENFNGIGVSFRQVTGSLIFLFVKDTIVRNNYTGGIWVSGSSGVQTTTRATIEKTRMDGNNYGVRASGKTLTTVRDCVASGSGNAGYLADININNGVPGTMFIENSLATHNVNGFSVDSGGVMSISNIVAIANFNNDVFVGSSGSLQTFGNNKYVNGPNGTPLPVR